jgi:predicted N-formylglutamate amidohydrolase
MSSPSLLHASEPGPFVVERDAGASPFVLICDHAGRRIPQALGDLGIAEADLQRHIAWDIGAAALAAELAHRLDAFLITQTYSRLVIDCNRPPASPGSILERSDHTDIPANRNLPEAQRSERVRAIFEPYHARIAQELDRREALQQPTILISVHSFTPVFDGVARRWHLGVLYQRDARAAHVLLDAMREDARWIVGDNEPYAVSDATDYAIPVHGERRGLPHVELEVRQDLIAEAPGQREWGERLAIWLARMAAHADVQAGSAIDTRHGRVA